MPGHHLPDRTIALIAVVSSLATISLVGLFIYLRRRHKQKSTDLERTGSDSPPVKFEERKQTHADRKVFSWLVKVDADADRKGIFRMSIPDRKSVFTLGEEEMKDLSAALDRLRGRESVMTRRASDGPVMRWSMVS